MNKRPDQYRLDHGEGGSTDYKFRRRSEDQNHPNNVEEGDAAQEATTGTPNNQMEARRQQSEQDREAELERAREAKQRGEGHHGTGPGSDDQGDRSEERESSGGGSGSGSPSKI